MVAKVRFVIVLLFLFLLFRVHNGVLIAQSGVALNPIEDAHVKGEFSDRNYGNASELITSDYGSNNNVVYMKFDLSNVSGNVSSATLRLTPILARSVSKEIKIVNNSSWSEGSITFDNAPARGETVGSINGSVTAGNSVDIQLNANQLNSFTGQNLTLAIDNTGSGDTFSVSSSEASSGQPQLVINADGGGGGGGDETSDGDVNGDGQVNITDYNLVVSNFGDSFGSADFNDNGRVDVFDFALVVRKMLFQPIPTPTPQATSTPTATPVPTSNPTSTPGSSPPPHMGAGAPPDDCTKYPEPRVFLESQGWWWLRLPDQQTGDDFGHVHLGTCFPHGQTISGDVDFKIRVMMHDNPGYIHHVGVDVWEGASNYCFGGNISCQDFTDLPGGGLTCGPGETCAWWTELTVPTDVLRSDGRKEFRFRAFQEQPDGNRLFQSTGWQAYIDNGKSVSNYRGSDFVEARGWYTGAEYQNPRLEIPNIDPNDKYNLNKKVSGIWRPTIEIKRGSGGNETDYHMVMIDPGFHADPPNEGWVIKEGPGEIQNHEIEIDTTRLENGWHRLVLRADDDFRDSSGECADNKGGTCDSTLSGLLIVFFYVEN